MSRAEPHLVVHYEQMKERPRAHKMVSERYKKMPVWKQRLIEIIIPTILIPLLIGAMLFWNTTGKDIAILQEKSDKQEAVVERIDRKLDSMIELFFKHK